MEPQTIAQLIAVMEEQTKVMSDLVAMSKKKSQVLVEGHMEQLEVLLRGEQALIWQMGRFEERRFQLQVAVAAQMGIQPDQLTLEYLLKNMPHEYVQRCQRVAQEYGRVAGDLSQANRVNSELIHQAMAYVDFSLQLLGAAGPAGSKTYSPTGVRPKPADGKIRRLDNRA